MQKNMILNLHEQSLKEKFAELIKTLGQTKVLLLLLLMNMINQLLILLTIWNKQSFHVQELKNFYGTLKGTDVDANMHFLFVTGVSKFSKVALFSDLNNLEDLTNDTRRPQPCWLH